MKKIATFLIAMLAILGPRGLKAAAWQNWSNFSKVTGMVQKGSQLWVAGHGGVVVIDTATLQKTFYHKTAGQLPSLMVEDIQLDAASGDVWIGTYDNGLVQVHNGNWTTFSFPTNFNLYHIAVDGAGAVWCATSTGFYKFAHGSYSLDSNSLTSFVWDVKLFPDGKMLLASIYPVIFDPGTDSAHEVRTSVVTYGPSYITIENDSSFYFTAMDQGISHVIDTSEIFISDSVVLNNNTDQVLEMKIIGGNLTALTANNKLYRYSSGTWFADAHNADALATAATCLFQDPNDKLWLGGAGNGGVLRPLNGAADITIKKFALNANLVTSLTDKSSGEIWVTAGNEIGIYDKNSNAFTQVYELPITNSYNYYGVGGIANWNGTIVALTDSGLFKFDGTGWNYFNIPGTQNPVDYFLCIAADTSGNLYIGTVNGVIVVNRSNHYLYNTSNTPAFGGSGVLRKAFFDAGRNTMWFATPIGIVRYTNGNFSMINASSEPQLSYYTYINSIAQDSAGSMWFGTAYGGLIKYDGTNYTLDSVDATAGDQIINAIAFDGATMYAADNVFGFWIKNNGVWTSFSYANSDITGSYLSGLYVDQHHNVWITAQGDGTIEAFGIDLYNKNQIVLENNDLRENQGRIYPNPTNGRLFIASDQIKDGEEIFVNDLLGREAGVYRIANGEINTGGLPSGVYFLHTGTLTLKFVKE